MLGILGHEHENGKHVYKSLVRSQFYCRMVMDLYSSFKVDSRTENNRKCTKGDQRYVSPWDKIGEMGHFLKNAVGWTLL